MEKQTIEYIGLGICACIILFYVYWSFLRAWQRSVKLNEQQAKTAVYSDRMTEINYATIARVIGFMATCCLLFWLLSHRSPDFFFIGLGASLLYLWIENNFRKSLDKKMLEKDKRHINAIVMELRVVEKHERDSKRVKLYHNVYYRFKTADAFHDGVATIPKKEFDQLQQGGFIVLQYAGLNPAIHSIVGYAFDPAYERGI